MVRVKDEIALTFYKRVDVGVHDFFGAYRTRYVTIKWTRSALSNFIVSVQEFARQTHHNRRSTMHVTGCHSFWTFLVRPNNNEMTN